MQFFSLLSLLALSTSVAMQDSLPRIPDREQRELDMWEDFWRWRREQNRGRGSRKGDRSGRHRDRGSDYDSDHEGRRRRRDGRERGHENDRDERIRQPVIPINPDYPPSLPIIIDPIQILPKPSMPSIIEPYPIVSSTPSLPYISSHAPSTSQYYEATSSIYYSSSILYTSTLPTKKQIYQPKTNSTTDAYASTTIVTVPESTVRTKVTGRYRAMSNSAGNLNSNITGSISFVLIVLSSIFLLSLV